MNNGDKKEYTSLLKINKQANVFYVGNEWWMEADAGSNIFFNSKEITYCEE